MGPRRIRSGKPCLVRGGASSLGMLQWGHGESAVENTGVKYGDACLLNASMGPRRIRRGKLAARERAPDDVVALQWGHGESAVENRCHCRACRAARMGLQWGHGESAVEN